jgi:hypothetical protein
LVAALVGVETAKLVLKRTFETIEKSIDTSRKVNQHGHSNLQVPGRATWWITSPPSNYERGRLIRQIGRTLLPHETLEEFVSAIEAPVLATKAVTS